MKSFTKEDCLLASTPTIILKPVSSHCKSSIKIRCLYRSKVCKAQWRMRGVKCSPKPACVQPGAKPVFHLFKCMGLGWRESKNSNILWYVKIIWNSNLESINKGFLEWSHAHSVSTLPTPAFVWQWQSQVAKRETVSPQDLQYLLAASFTGKVCWPPFTD